MRDPRDDMWDEYHRMCQVHKQMIAIEERTGKPHPDSYDTALACYNLMQKCLNPEASETRMDPDLAEFLDYITENPFLSQEELHTAGFRSDRMKEAVEKLKGKIYIDRVGTAVRYWPDIDRSGYNSDQTDEIVAQYVGKCFPATVVIASHHLRIPEYRVRKSMNKQKFPKGQEFNEVMQPITAYFPHGTKTKKSVARGQISKNNFSNSIRRQKRDNY